MGLRNTACSSRPLPPRLNSPDTRSREITVPRGTTWTIHLGTADMTLNDHKCQRQYRPAVTLLLLSRKVFITSGLLLHLRRAYTRLFIRFRTPTRQTLRLALNGPTPRAHHHARRLAVWRRPAWDTASAVPPVTRTLHMATTSRSRLLPFRPNLNPRRRETRLTPGRPRQETSTTTTRNRLLPMKTNGLLGCCSHRHDPHIPRYRKTGHSDPSPHCNCL